MRSCCHKLGNCVSECRSRMHMENRERVFALNQSSGGKNHRNEVCTGILKKRERRGPCEELVRYQSTIIPAQRRFVLALYLNVCRGNIAYHIPMVINHDKRRYSFCIHQLKSFTKRLIAAERKVTVSIWPNTRIAVSGKGLLDGDHIVRANTQAV